MGKAHAEVFITAGVRTPIGSFGGGLKEFSAPQLGDHVAKACIQRSGLRADAIDQVILGHARQAGCGPNPARQVAMLAGVPKEREAFTVNQACNSGLKTIIIAAQQIALGQAQCILAGGMESMSNTPYYLTRARFGLRMGHDEVVDGMYRDGFFCPMAEQLMGDTAENLVDQFKISRAAQDQYAARSQNRAEKAIAAGWYRDEIEPVQTKQQLIQQDEHPRKGVTADSLAKLKPVFRDNGSVHAGNSSGVTDGASAVMVLGENQLKNIDARNNGLVFRIVGYSVCGVDPKVMGIGPVPAVRQVLQETGLQLSQMDLIELNEAFAAQVLAVDQELKFDPEKLNVQGGAIALGHPIGATGCRIVVTLMHALKRTKGRYGLATLCVSGGMGGALIIERIFL